VKTGEVQNDKKTFEAFYTPMPLVARLVEMAELRKGLKVLEPSAGDGRIAFAAEKVVGPKNVTCCEIRDGEDGASVQLADRFPFFHGDFLEVPAHRKFDRIIMNPPFHRGTDIKHVTHALEFLNGAGLLVSVMSAGARTASTKVAGVFRERLYGYDVTWHDVEDGAFKESGTNVRTVILKVRVP
jgi:predicted RNA methylase